MSGVQKRTPTAAGNLLGPVVVGMAAVMMQVASEKDAGLAPEHSLFQKGEVALVTVVVVLAVRLGVDPVRLRDA